MEKYYYVMGMRYIPDVLGALRKLELYSGRPDYHVARAMCEKFSKRLRTENPRRVKLPILSTSTAAEASGLLRAGGGDRHEYTTTEVMMKFLIGAYTVFMIGAVIWLTAEVMSGFGADDIKKAMADLEQATVPTQINGTN
jgi:hypothetical protein